MAQYIYSIDKKIVLHDEIPADLVGAFDKLKSELETDIASLTCPTHHREPLVYLRFGEGRVRCSGFSPCCEEFGETLKLRIRNPVSDEPNSVWVSRLAKYSKA